MAILTDPTLHSSCLHFRSLFGACLSAARATRFGSEAHYTPPPPRKHRLCSSIKGRRVLGAFTCLQSGTIKYPYSSDTLQHSPQKVFGDLVEPCLTICLSGVFFLRSLACFSLSLRLCRWKEFATHGVRAPTQSARRCDGRSLLFVAMVSLCGLYAHWPIDLRSLPSLPAWKNFFLKSLRTSCFFILKYVFFFTAKSWPFGLAVYYCAILKSLVFNQKTPCCRFHETSQTNYTFGCLCIFHAPTQLLVYFNTHIKTFSCFVVNTRSRN